MSHSQHYSAEGDKIPSVSEIPNIFAKNMDGFEDWICRGLHGKEDLCCTKAKRKYYEEAANLGNDIHSLREGYLRGETFSEGVPEYQAKVFDPVAKFYKESGYKPLQIKTSEGDSIRAIELKMTGKDCGGTCDGFGKFSMPFWQKARKTLYDKRTRNALEKGIIKEPSIEDIFCDDLKIKSKLDVLHPLQLFKYSKLAEEVHNIECKWGLILRREKKLDIRPELQIRIYYLPLFEPEWDASFLMWNFLNK